MFGSAIIDTAIGLTFVFFLIAVFTSAVVEWIANLLSKRAKTLLIGLRELLEPKEKEPPSGPAALRPVTAMIADSKAEGRLNTAALGLTGPAKAGEQLLESTGMVAAVMSHSLIEPFKRSRGSGGKVGNPSYLPGSVVAKVLVDMLIPASHAQSTTMTEIHDLIKNHGDTQLEKSLLVLARTTQGTLTDFLKAIEDWYDAQMQRVSGMYKRWAKKVSIVVAVIVVAGLHVDTIAIATHLWSDAPARAAVITAAADLSGCTAPTAVPSDSPTPSAVDPNKAARDCVNAKVDVLKDAGIPIGPQLWSWAELARLPQLIPGFVIAIIAASMGAPFWFATLNRLTSIRNAGPKPTSETD